MSLRVGIDLVRVSRIDESLGLFGDRFLRRIFTEGEIAYAAAAPALRSERLAARFAAKEAALKALGLPDGGVGWREIEVVGDGGPPALLLHGAAAAALPPGSDIALSLSCEGDYATAVVVTSPGTSARPSEGRAAETSR